MCIWWSVARPSAQTLNPKPTAPDTPLNQTKTTKPATRTQPEPGRQPSKRGVGLSFGPDVTEKFLARNNLKMVVRSHEVRKIDVCASMYIDINMYVCVYCGGGG